MSEAVSSFVEAIWSFEPTDDRQLEMRKGDQIRVTRKYNEDWWEGELNGHVGLFPRNRVRVVETANESTENPFEASSVVQSPISAQPDQEQPAAYVMTMQERRRSVNISALKEALRQEMSNAQVAPSATPPPPGEKRTSISAERKKFEEDLAKNLASGRQPGSISPVRTRRSTVSKESAPEDIVTHSSPVPVLINLGQVSLKSASTQQPNASKSATITPIIEDRTPKQAAPVVAAPSVNVAVPTARLSMVQANNQLQPSSTSNAPSPSSSRVSSMVVNASTTVSSSSGTPVSARKMEDKKKDGERKSFFSRMKENELKSNNRPTTPSGTNINTSNSKEEIRHKLFGFFKSRPSIETLKEKGILPAEPGEPSSNTKSAVLQQSASFQDRAFGGYLHHQCQREGNAVPGIVVQCIEAVEARGLDMVGIYRLSGSTNDIQRLRTIYNENPMAPLNLTDSIRWNDINVITGALKLYFRELMNPLLTFERFDAFIAAVKHQDVANRPLFLKQMVRSLPAEHYYTLQYLINHLTRVAANGAINKMETANLAIVFGPTILRAERDTMETIMAIGHQNQVVDLLICNYNSIFNEP